MNQAPVIIVDYDPQWPILFEREKELILRALDGIDVQVEHGGSTAVPGLAAKPIIDIFVEAATPEEGERAVPRLAAIGYEYWGEFGIPGRFYFNKGEPRTYHLHMYPCGHSEWARHILFRDYLRTHPDASRAYGELKYVLAEKYRHDRGAYTESKSEFVKGVEALMTNDPGIHSEPYRGPDDLTEMIAALPSSRPAGWHADFPGPRDLAELLAQSPIAACARLWRDGSGRVLAYALLDDAQNLWFDRVREASGALTAELIAWGVSCARESSGHGASLDTACRGEDEERIHWLCEFGFVEQGDRTLYLSRSLSEPIPDPVLPPGYSIRALHGEDELEAVVALHRAAFGTDYMTVEKRRLWMQAQDYDPELDLIAVAPDGHPASYCFCVAPKVKNRPGEKTIGVTDPLATHPAHQGRGLARALLLTGMRLLRERGAVKAVLGTSSDNLAMQAAAQAAGYRVESERVWFRHKLREK